MKKLSKPLTYLMCLILIGIMSCSTGPTEYDIVIYGGTSAGIVAAVQATRMGKTVIIISHRLETVKSADKILKIENGKIFDIKLKDLSI